MNRFKDFMAGVIKLAVAIMIVVVCLVALGCAIYAVWHARESTKSAALAELRTWPPIRIEALGNVDLKLSTSWRDGLLYYQFVVDGYPDAISAVRDGSQGQKGPHGQAKFTFALLDTNGFKLFDHAVALQEMARKVDQKGVGCGLNANDHTYVRADVYQMATSWSVTWNFRTPSTQSSSRSSP